MTRDSLCLLIPSRFRQSIMVRNRVTKTFRKRHYYQNFGSASANVHRAWGPSSDHSGGVVVHAFADGHTSTIPASTDAKVSSRSTVRAKVCRRQQSSSLVTDEQCDLVHRRESSRRCFFCPTASRLHGDQSSRCAPQQLGPLSAAATSAITIGTAAAVAELADAHDSGSCARKGVVVRLHSAALSFVSRLGIAGRQSGPANALRCRALRCRALEVAGNSAARL